MRSSLHSARKESRTRTVRYAKWTNIVKRYKTWQQKVLLNVEPQPAEPNAPDTVLHDPLCWAATETSWPAAVRWMPCPRTRSDQICHKPNKTTVHFNLIFVNISSRPLPLLIIF